MLAAGEGASRRFPNRGIEIPFSGYVEGGTRFEYDLCFPYANLMKADYLWRTLTPCSPFRNAYVTRVQPDRITRGGPRRRSSETRTRSDTSADGLPALRQNVDANSDRGNGPWTLAQLSASSSANAERNTSAMTSRTTGRWEITAPPQERPIRTIPVTRRRPTDRLQPALATLLRLAPAGRGRPGTRATRSCSPC